MIEADLSPSTKLALQTVQHEKERSTLSLQANTSTEDADTNGISFDESPLTFDPSKHIPFLKTHWGINNGDASYGLLTHAFVLVNSTQSRLKIVDTLVNFLRTLIEADPDSLLPAVRDHSFLSLFGLRTDACRSGVASNELDIATLHPS